ncbi:TniQ family protein [Propionivibrio dicarboxylicus]|uniref:TniQ protein n=1 Tax=Propionivibrio dicarboxylicus TaxID=83767 RepID=A0A1G7V9H3_9RHOO|nr:TniQ family protein [Propionivibrio dicarboxylicus]SDG56413.1 TniQ protein [Propionivibrio dicarboxylicus]
MSEFRVIHRVTPFPEEYVLGYLHRVAEKNGIKGIQSLLSDALGTPRHSVSLTVVTKLATYCRLYPEEVEQLSGIERRNHDGVRSWQVCGEWVTKAAFIAPNHRKFCPCCLREAPFVRGCWQLVFYNACARHRTRLLDCCPKCRKRLNWTAHRLEYCACGYKLADAEALHASNDALTMSFLIELRGGARVPPGESLGVGHREFDLLAGLSLDGLHKTIWFLGHCLKDLGRYGTGHGRLKRGQTEVDLMIRHTFELLKDWPKGFGDLLAEYARRPPADYQGPLEGRLLGPVQRYLRQELDGEEMAFIRLTYEQHLRTIWQEFGHKHRLRRVRQLEFDFEKQE